MSASQAPEAAKPAEDRRFWIALSPLILAGLAALWVLLYRPWTLDTVYHNAGWEWAGLGSGLALLYCLLGGWFVAGSRAKATRWIASLFVPALVAIPGLMYMGAHWINAEYDVGPESWYAVELLDMRRKRNDQSGFYYLESWREPGRTLMIQMPDNEYYRGRRREQKVIVYTRPGYLGYEWIVSVRNDRRKPAAKSQEAPPGLGGNVAGPTPARRE